MSITIEMLDSAPGSYMPKTGWLLYGGRWQALPKMATSQTRTGQTRKHPTQRIRGRSARRPILPIKRTQLRRAVVRHAARIDADIDLQLIALRSGCHLSPY